MPQTAYELKNKFIYALREFREDEIEREWKEYLLTHDSNDDHGFVKLMQMKSIHRQLSHELGNLKF